MKNQRSFFEAKTSGKAKKFRSSEHGGSYKNPQKRKRPLAFRARNHFVLKSSKAKKEWSFRRHKFVISHLLQKFARKHHIGLISFANVGNHLHLYFEVSDRTQYKKFIRAISSAIMIHVTGYSRWNPSPNGFKFWDARPFSRIVSTWTEMVRMEKYIAKNQWQGYGFSNQEARQMAHLGWVLARDG